MGQDALALLHVAPAVARRALPCAQVLGKGRDYVLHGLGGIRFGDLESDAELARRILRKELGPLGEHPGDPRGVLVVPDLCAELKARTYAAAVREVGNACIWVSLDPSAHELANEKARRPLRWIEEVGGAYQCDEQERLRAVDLRRTSPSAEQLRKLATNKTLVALAIGGAVSWRVQPLAPDAIAALGRFRQLESLELEMLALEQLDFALLSRLRTLSLLDTDVDHRTLERLGTLRHLSALRVVKAPLTGLGFGALEAAGALARVHLSYTGLTDRGLAELARLESLESIDLEPSNVGDGGVARLAQLDRLAELFIGRTRITSGVCEHLAPLARLRVLSVRSANVDDRAVRSLLRLEGLERLDIAGTLLTERGARALLQLPKLTEITVSAPLDGELRPHARAGVRVTMAPRVHARWWP